MGNWIRAITAILISLMVFVAFATDCHAEKWVMIGIDDEGTVHSVDSESVKRSGNIASAWTKAELTTPKSIGDKDYDMFIDLEEWNCEIKSYRPLKSIIKYTDGTEAELASDHSSTWKYASPKSMEEAEYRVICK